MTRSFAAFIGFVVLVCSFPVHASTQAESSTSAPTDTKIYLVGGDVKPPQPIGSKQPDLTKEEKQKARNAKASGKVELTVIVGSDGEVKRARVDTQTSEYLGQKAVEAVKSWKFKPATKKGVPVNAQIHIQVNFNLWD
jgi:periplasmic protein TonB